jgi:hypothetical protein
VIFVLFCRAGPESHVRAIRYYGLRGLRLCWLANLCASAGRYG